MSLTEAADYPNRMLIEHLCDNCGSGFSSTKPAPQFCSHECYREVLSKKMQIAAPVLWLDPQFVAKIQTARRAVGYRTDPDAPLRSRLRSIIKRAIRRCVKAGHEKSGRTITLLGYSPDDLRCHLECLFKPGMSWSNYGEWEVDHVIPIAWFPISTSLSEINALSNLQPLWAVDNRKKGRQLVGV